MGDEVALLTPSGTTLPSIPPWRVPPPPRSSCPGALGRGRRPVAGPGRRPPCRGPGTPSPRLGTGRGPSSQCAIRVGRSGVRPAGFAFTRIRDATREGCAAAVGRAVRPPRDWPRRIAGGRDRCVRRLSVPAPAPRCRRRRMCRASAAAGGRRRVGGWVRTSGTPVPLGRTTGRTPAGVGTGPDRSGRRRSGSAGRRGPS